MTETCYNVFSEAETLALARSVGEGLSPGDTVAFFGGLGMGKTLFTKGLAEGMGLDPEEVGSPTYTIMREYGGGKNRLIHFDMYRVMGEESLASAGFFDLLDSGCVLAVEWSENIEEYLPENALRVIIEPGDREDARRITVRRPALNSAGGGK
ncbi:MAG: tRNA (adenosine(37)-N6)-threonylcarbamoyltransferase complex ATPase subunit type 1 TsaE [Oscillospiraceae bacterium]|jgi:tRNA threonylcarbamoyladenosine biosynthesis protein TsaE|nr:tRNA (adenosine(37)-N6)-threonylcarbamoyltransferase complex ATPase subunit type 1 TsaE [Oscillospiraceae bacterium]